MNTGNLLNSPLIKGQSSSCSVYKFNTPLSIKVVVEEGEGEIKEKQLRLKVSINHIALLLKHIVDPLLLPFLKDQSSILSF
jgi:hypothetical protein